MKKILIALIATPVIIAGTAYAKMDGEGFGKGDCDMKKPRHGHFGDKGERGERMLKRMLKRMSKQLNLNEEQTAAVQKLMDERKNERKQLHRAMQNLHEQVRNLNPAADNYPSELAKTKESASKLAISRIDKQVGMKEEMAKILTPEQLKQLDEIKGSHNHRGHFHSNFAGNNESR